MRPLRHQISGWGGDGVSAAEEIGRGRRHRISGLGRRWVLAAAHRGAVGLLKRPQILRPPAHGTREAAHASSPAISSSGGAVPRRLPNPMPCPKQI
ncbi:unnamed protein product [Urochloa humidicola]